MHVVIALDHNKSIHAKNRAPQFNIAHLITFTVNGTVNLWKVGVYFWSVFWTVK